MGYQYKSPLHSDLHYVDKTEHADHPNSVLVNAI